MKNIYEAIDAGLWPESKAVTSEKGILKLESLGYKLFYIGKNADLYFIPGEIPKVLMVRTDRTSVFDIPLDLEIKGKGEIQNLISCLGFEFAEKMGINIALSDIPKNIPIEIALRCQVIELCKPIEIILDGEMTGIELIFRNYLTGSLLELVKLGKDPYGLNLPIDLNQWYKFSSPIFTPTTKGLKDKPILYKYVQSIYPEIIDKLNNLFIDFTEFAYLKGIVVVDTKFEVFVDSNGNWVLGDEVLTPESSRFITVNNFKNRNYLSMDKQILRDYGKKEKWVEKSKKLKFGERLSVNVPEEIQKQIISGYQNLYGLLL